MTQACYSSLYFESTPDPVMHFAMMRLLLLLIAADAFSNSSHGSVSVWDNVLPEGAPRAVLHEYASRAGLAHRCFSRPLVGAGRNVLERTLDALLTELAAGDGYVEYWTRQEWRHIEAHADVDEHRAKQPLGSSDGNGEETPEVRFPATYRPTHGYRYPIKG